MGWVPWGGRWGSQRPQARPQPRPRPRPRRRRRGRGRGGGRCGSPTASLLLALVAAVATTRLLPAVAAARDDAEARLVVRVPTPGGAAASRRRSLLLVQGGVTPEPGSVIECAGASERDPPSGAVSLRRHDDEDGGECATAGDGGGRRCTLYVVGDDAVSAVAQSLAAGSCVERPSGTQLRAAGWTQPPAAAHPPPRPPLRPPHGQPAAREMRWVLEGLAVTGVLDVDYEAQWGDAFGSALAPGAATTTAVDDAVAGLRRAGIEAGAALAGLPPTDSVMLSAAGRRSLIANATRAYARASADAASPHARLSRWLASAVTPSSLPPAYDDHAAALGAEVREAVDAVVTGYLPRAAAPAAAAGDQLLEVGGGRTLQRGGGHVDAGRAATKRLLTMLVEVHSKTSALVAAGVTSKEIFACVVDLIMDAAPEIILQIIVSAVRDPIVNVVGMIMALIVPPILVPSAPPGAGAGDARFATTDAQAAAWSWLHDSAYGAPAGGPIAHMMPKLKEGIVGGLTAVALPRVAAGTTRAVLATLDASLPASLHRGIARATIFALTQRLTDGIFIRTTTAVARRLASGTANTLVSRLVPPLSRTLSHALAHSLTRHPATDYFCAYCAAATTGNATAPADGAVEAAGPYCIACRRARAHDALLDTTLETRWRAAADAEVAAALRRLPLAA